MPVQHCRYQTDSSHVAHTRLSRSSASQRSIVAVGWSRSGGSETVTGMTSPCEEVPEAAQVARSQTGVGGRGDEQCADATPLQNRGGGLDANAGSGSVSEKPDGLLLLPA